MNEARWRKRYVTQDLPDNSLLAFDVNVSSKEIGKYAKRGHQVVCCCKEGEADEAFLERAYCAGAEYVFSQDSDIGNIIEKENYPMRWIRHV